MTAQAQAPTEEMRATAAEIATHLGLSSEYAVRQILAALAAQDALAVERCAKWHDEQAAHYESEAAGYFEAKRDYSDYSAACSGRERMHTQSAAALRAEGEK